MTVFLTMHVVYGMKVKWNLYETIIVITAFWFSRNSCFSCLYESNGEILNWSYLLNYKNRELITSRVSYIIPTSNIMHNIIIVPSHQQRNVSFIIYVCLKHLKRNWWSIRNISIQCVMSDSEGG